VASGIVAGSGESIVNRSTSDAASARGLVYSRPDGRPVRGRCWHFWILQRSKKVWFRIDPNDSDAPLGPLLFRYDGRAILHHSELAAWQASQGTHPPPVIWGKYLGIGFGQGPEGTNLYLNLWTRWTWLHPEACGHPERFSVVMLGTRDAWPC
jgi:hypothetical protein